MLQKRKRTVWKSWFALQLMFLALLCCFPVPVGAAGDVQFTTGKYGQNCLTVGNSSTSAKDLTQTQNVYLDAAARKRANQGELTLDAYVHVGANGSRTNTRKLEVKCFNQSGAQVGSTWSQESKSYSVKHNWNDLSFSGKTIPKNTYRIQYYVSNHIGTKGDLEIQNCSMTIRDTVKPSVANITGATDDGRSFVKPHPAGTKVTYTVHFSERVTATSKGTPTIEPTSSDITSGSVTETSDGGSTISYTYVIPKNGSVISDNHRIALKSISSFTIKDDAGNTTKVSLTEDDINKFNSSLTSSGNLYMDNRPPELTEITSEGFSKDTVLCAGDTIKLHLNFHENIKVTGSPSITLSNGKTATYVPTKTTTSLASFSYTVGKGDDVNALAIQSFQLGGIVDGVDQDTTASTKYGQFTSKYKNYLQTYSVKIDTQPPTVQLPDFDETWLSKDHIVQVSASDDTESMTGSGIKYVQYAWSEQAESAPQQFTDAWCNDEGLFEIKMPAGDGNWYLWLVCQDMVGNTADPVCSTSTAKLDVMPPDIQLTTKEINEQVISVSAEITDSVSGVAERTYAWYNEENKRVDAGTFEEGQPIPRPLQSGTYLLKLSATDVAGNKADCEQQVLIDCTPPVVSISCETAGYAKVHQMQVACSDLHTVVEKTEYQWKEGSAPANEEDWKVLESDNVTSPENENLLQSEDTTDDVGHGTKIAELICMYAPSAVVVPLKVSGKDADTEPETVIQSIYDAIDNYDCQVICMAFSIPDSEDLQAVVAYAKRHQVILISAVGNLGETYKKDKLLYPAAYDSVIGVGAVDAQGTVATYSQKNDSVFVTAEETALDGESRGTSFAAARIAAICARRSWSTPEDFRQYLMEEAEDAGDPGYDTSYGWGICTP